MTDAARLRALFERLLDLPPAERPAALEALEVDDSTRARIAALLSTDERLGASTSALEDETTGARRHPWPGDSIGAYRLIAPLGDGGMGSVWLAASRSASEVRVAIKFPRAHGVGVEESRLRLEQERRILSALHHPGIVSLVDAGTTAAEDPYLVLEVLEGQPLDRWAERTRGRGAREELLVKLASAIDHLHARGFVHRDIKPANVLVTDDGWPVLIDFGAGRVTEDASVAAALVTQGSAPHTPAFASPEQVRGEQATPRADVYAFGLVARMLLGEHLDARGRRAVEQACADDVEARPGSAGEVVELLRGTRRRAAAPSVVTVALLMLAALAIGVLVATRLRPESELDPRLLVALAEAPAAELSFEPELLLELAEANDDPGLAVAAAVLSAEFEVTEGLRPLVERSLDDLERLTSRRRSELAVLLQRLGLPVPALTAFEGVDERALDPVEVLVLELSEIDCWIDLGHEPDLERLAELAEELAEELGEDDEFERVLSMRIERGDPEALDWWFEELGEVELGELHPRAALALIGLRQRLVPDTPLPSPVLEPLLEIAWAGLEDDPLGPGNALAARLALLATDADDEDAEGRANAIDELLGVFEERDGVPVVARAELLLALGLELRAMGAPSAEDTIADALQIAADACGDDAPRVEWMRAVAAEERSVLEPVDPTCLIDAREARALARDADVDPWWLAD